MVDYSKWKDIEVSDDEDDTHPNIDTPSLFRMRHQARLLRMEDAEREKKEFQQRKDDLVTKKKQVENWSGTEDELKKLKSEIEVLEKKIKDEEEELKKKEKLTPWNVDTIGHDGFSRTVINAKGPAPEPEISEEEKAKRLQKFVKENKKLLDHFGFLRKYEDSKRFLLEHPHLAHEDTANYLTLECVNLAMLEKFDLMDHVSHQCIAIQFLLELSKQLKVDPRACISTFFSKMGHLDQAEYKEAFDSELALFRGRIRKRAEEKIEEAMEEERKANLGPGGLDPIEVLETLPEKLKQCFLDKDVQMLQEVLKELPEDEARAHMKRCVDSGLWVPGGGSDEEGNSEGKEKSESVPSEASETTKSS